MPAGVRQATRESISSFLSTVDYLFCYDYDDILWKRKFDRKLQTYSGWEKLISTEVNRGQTTVCLGGVVKQIRMSHVVWYIMTGDWPSVIKFKDKNSYNYNYNNMYLDALDGALPTDNHYHKSQPLPPLYILEQYLKYNHITGIFIWKKRKGLSSWNAKYEGNIAGYESDTGHIKISINGVKYLAHRIAWKMHYGKDPSYEIDHDDGDYSHNAIKNLNDVFSSKNQKNMKLCNVNTSGITGVAKKRNKWRAYISINGRQLNLGSFDTFEKAVAARKTAEVRLGFHKNHGKVLQCPQA